MLSDLQVNEPVNSPTIFDPSNVFVKIAEETFSEIIKKILLSEADKQKYSFIISTENLDIMNKIISKTPNTFNDIEDSIKEIIKDGKINSNDIPQLIILVQRIYQVLYNIKNYKLDSIKISDITSKILKFIIYILVEKKKIKIEKQNEEEFFRQTNLLIDSCISLLSFPKSIKVKGCWKSIFCGN